MAAPKVLLDRYLSILQSAELTPVGAETEIVQAPPRPFSGALHPVKARFWYPWARRPRIWHLSAITFSPSPARFPPVATRLARALAQGLEFTPGQAEEYKRTYGLQPDKLDGKFCRP